MTYYVAMQAQVTAEHELWHFLEQIAFYSIILPLLDILFMFDIFLKLSLFLLMDVFRNGSAHFDC